MHSVKRLFIALLIVLLLLPGVALAINVGEPAPDFSLKTLEGQSVSLSDFRGRVVLVKLATTWCPTCKQLSIELSKVSDFLREHNVAVLEIFVQDSATMIERFLEDKNFTMTYYSLIDDGQAYRSYNVYLIPRLVVVDPEGVVSFDSAGRNVTAEQLRELVQTALPEPAAEATHAPAD